MSEGYDVVRVRLSGQSAFVVQALAEINAGLEHLFILGVECEQEWLPTPRLSRKLMAGDHMVIYGKLEDLAERFG